MFDAKKLIKSMVMSVVAPQLSAEHENKPHSVFFLSVTPFYLSTSALAACVPFVWELGCGDIVNPVHMTRISCVRNNTYNRFSLQHHLQQAHTHTHIYAARGEAINLFSE